MLVPKNLLLPVLGLLTALVVPHSRAAIFYSIDIDADVLVSIDSETGAVTVVGDLGIDMHYKRRWAETPSDTVSLAIMRE